MNLPKLPIFMSCEALLVPGAGSMATLDISGEITAGDLKKLSARPKNVAKAVTQFKKDGFKVTSIGKYSIGIWGLTTLFMDKFKTQLQVNDKGEILTLGGQSIIQFSTKYADVIEVIILPKPVIPMLGNAPKVGEFFLDGERVIQRKDTQPIPEELPVYLGVIPKGIDQTLENAKNHIALLNSGKGVKIAVVDSGFYHHSYFKKNYPNTKVKVIVDSTEAIKKAEVDNTIQLINRVVYKLKEIRSHFNDNVKTLSEYEDWINVNFTEEGELKAYMSVLSGLKKLFKSLKQTFSILPFTEEQLRKIGYMEDIEDVIDMAEVNLDILKKNIYNIGNISTNYNDPGNHGTSVLSCLIPFAPEAEITLYKKSFGSDEYETMFFKAIKDKPNIISSSWGTYIFQGLENYIKPANWRMLTKIIEAERNKTMLLFASGNWGGHLTKEQRAQIDFEKTPYDPAHSYESDFKEVLSIGGAYKVGEKIKASDSSYGYEYEYEYIPPYGGKKIGSVITPDICGWNGELKSDDYNIWVPISPSLSDGVEGWKLTQGTSLSTPQIAGACALLQSAIPGSTPEDIEAALMKTVDRIEEGVSAQGVEMSTLKGSYGKIGLANIDSAHNALLVIQVDKLNEFFQEQVKKKQ